MPHGHDPVALRELFSPAFLDWTTTIDREVDFGASERQLYFLWRLRERTRDELELALSNAGKLFRRVRAEIDEHGLPPTRPGPGTPGMEPFPEGGAGQVAGRARRELRGVVVARLAGEDDLERLLGADHARGERDDRPLGGVREHGVGVGEAAQLLEVLDRREGELELVLGMLVEGGGGGDPAGVVHLDAVGLRLAVGRRQRDVEAGVEAGRDLLGGDPARPGEERLGVDLDPGLLAELARAADAMGELVGIDVAARTAGRFAVRLLDDPAGEHPDAGHESGLLAALEHQHLEAAIRVLAAAPQEDHRGGRTGDCGRGVDRATLR